MGIQRPVHKAPFVSGWATWAQPPSCLSRIHSSYLTAPPEMAGLLLLAEPLDGTLSLLYRNL